MGLGASDPRRQIAADSWRAEGGSRKQTPVKLRKPTGVQVDGANAEGYWAGNESRYRAKLPPTAKTQCAASATALRIGFRQKVRPEVALVRELPAGGRQGQRAETSA